MADPESPGKPRSPLGRLKARLGIGGWGELLIFAMPLLMWGGLSAPLATGLDFLAQRHLPGWGWRVGAYALAALLGLGLFAYAGIKEGRFAALIFLIMPFGIFWFLIQVFALLINPLVLLIERAVPAAGDWAPLPIALVIGGGLMAGLGRATAARLTERVPQETIDAASAGGLHELKPHLRPGDEIWRWETPKWTWDALIGRGGYVIVRAGKPTRHSVLAWMN